MNKTEIYTPPHEPRLSVWLSCDPRRRDIGGFKGMTYLHKNAAYIALPGASGMPNPVLAHEAIHAACHLLRLSKLDPRLGITWPLSAAATEAAAHEETLAWLVEQIVAGGERAYEAWAAKEFMAVGGTE
jgi:hypothetical protein